MDREQEFKMSLKTGSDYFESGDKAKAFAIWKELATQGYAKAQLFVAVCYQRGFGTEKDPYAALEWYQKAAAQNYPQAITYLASFYYDGIIERNTDEAVKLWKKAAEMGEKEAQFVLGNLYYYGDFFEPNKEEAIRWYRRSAQQLFHNAVKRMKDLGEWIFDENENEKWYDSTSLDHPVIVLPESWLKGY